MINSKLKTQNSKPPVSPPARRGGQLKSQNYKFLFVPLFLFSVFCLLFTLLTNWHIWEGKVVFGQSLPTEEATIGILRGIACTPSNWLCKTEDTVLPDILCCWWHCLPKEILPPHLCPTNEDLGQKDGTGKTGTDRHYYYYDYDLEKIVDVPPVLPD